MYIYIYIYIYIPWWAGGTSSELVVFAGLEPHMSGSMREQGSGKFTSLDAATDAELAERLGRFHKSQSKRNEPECG